MSFKQISRWPLARAVLLRLATWRVKEKVEEVIPNLKSTDSILDIGSGNGVLCYNLLNHGLKVTALDIDNMSLIGKIKPVISDAIAVPFRNSSFDVALLITVLHHTHNPAKVLLEAKRVAKKIIIVEEIYSNRLEKHLTYFIDSLFNLEFFNHPHTNMTDIEWRELFSHLGLTILQVSYARSILVLKRVTYILENDTGEV